MMFLRTNSPNWASRVAYFVAPSPGIQIKYFMTCVYWVIHEEPYHQITSKLRFELVLPSLSASLRACLIRLILQHSLDGNKWAHKKGSCLRCLPASRNLVHNCYKIVAATAQLLIVGHDPIQGHTTSP